MKSILIAVTITAGLIFSSGAYAQTPPYGTTDANDNFMTTGHGATYQSTGTAMGMDGVATLPNTATNKLVLYPNPVNSDTYIMLPIVTNTVIYVDVIDLNGNVERSYQYPTGTTNLDVNMSGLPASLYSVRVHNTELGDYNLKVIKE